MTHFNTRPIPEDFRENAAQMSRRELQRHYSAGQSTVVKWLASIGCRALRRPKTHMPEDFATVAPTMLMVDLMKRYGVRHGRIQTWCKLAGVAPRRNGLRPLPDDFAEVAPTLTKHALLSHYKTGWDCISRWIEESGVQPAEQVRIPPPYQSRGFVFRGPGATPLARDLRQITMYDQAADALRRQRFVVYRCGPTGKYLPDGLSWRVGNTIVSPDELLQRADKYREKAA